MGRVLTRRSIFVKLCTAFLSLIIVLLIIGYSIYNWGINIIRNEIISEACVQNKNFSDNLNAEIKRIILLQYELADNWDLIRLSTPLGSKYNEYEKSLMILRIKEKINAIKTSSKIIGQIKVVVPYIDKSIETLMVTDIESTSRKLIDKYADMEFKQIVYYNNELLLISEYPQVYYNRGIPPNFLIHSTISKQSLSQFLNEMSIYKGSKGFVLSDSRNMIISNDSNKETIEKIHRTILENKGEKVKSNNVEGTFALSGNVNGEKYIVIYTDTGLADIKLVRYVSERAAYAGLAKYRIVMWVFAIAAVIITALFSKSLYNTIHSPLKKLVKAFERVQNADFAIGIKHNKKDEFEYIYDSFNKMVIELSNLIDQVYKAGILVEKAKFKQLQAQINPHFLYNSFIILSNRIKIGDNEFAAEFCREIGSYFMYVTRNKNDIAPLKNEVDHAVTYAKIQEARFYNRMEMSLDRLPQEYEKIMVPRLILQPILENAFEHTLENMEMGGHLHMGYYAHDGYLDIIIEDNGTGLDDGQINQLQRRLDDNDAEITGMINIHQRLKLLFPDGCGITASRSSLGGLQVTVRVLAKGCEVNADV